MEELILDILGGPDFGQILTFIGIYLVAMWIMFCVWVFADARGRFGSFLHGLIWSLVVFVFNFPALIFYIVVRPEDDSWFDEHGHRHGGMEVPIVKFVGEDGDVHLSFNMSVSSNLNPGSDMHIDVGWNDERDDVDFSITETEKASGKGKAIANLFSSLSMPKLSLPKPKSPPKQIEKVSDEDKEEEVKDDDVVEEVDKQEQEVEEHKPEEHKEEKEEKEKEEEKEEEPKETEKKTDRHSGRPKKKRRRRRKNRNTAQEVNES